MCQVNVGQNILQQKIKYFNSKATSPPFFRPATRPEAHPRPAGEHNTEDGANPWNY